MSDITTGAPKDVQMLIKMTLYWVTPIIANPQSPDNSSQKQNVEQNASSSPYTHPYQNTATPSTILYSKPTNSSA